MKGKTLKSAPIGGFSEFSLRACFSSSAQLTGTLTLNAQGNPGAVFIFQIGSTLTTASNSAVNIINGGSACDVFWQVGTSATLGTNTSFMGNILALTSITLNTGASLSGSALAQNGATTLDSNIVSIAQCNAIFVAQPNIVKAFGAAAIGVGGTTTLSFTINNPNASIALTGVAFTDTLPPAGLIVSTPNNGLTGSCGGGTIAAVAGSGSVSLTGATLAGGASCTFSVNVTGTTLGAQNNSVTVTSANGDTGNTSMASLAVLLTPPPTAPPTIVKAFGAAAIGVGGTTTLSFTINNPNASTALTGVAFIDALPAGLIVSTSSNGLTGSCGGGIITAVAGSGSVSLTGATLAGSASCTFSVKVTGTTLGAQNNSVTVTSANGGTGNTSTQLLNVVVAVVAPPTISKSFGAGASILPFGTTALSFTIDNPNATVALTGVAFLDTLPAGLVVATPNGVNGSCGGGIITATQGSGSIGLTGATLAAGASCTFSVNVTVTIGGGFVTNITGNVTSSNGGIGNTAFAQIFVGTGTICVNVYALANEELESCCSCLVTPDGLVSLLVKANLLENPLFPGPAPTSLVIRLYATVPVGGSCSGSAALASPGVGGFLVGYAANLQAGDSAINITNTGLGLAAWGTTTHAIPGNNTGLVATETAFTPATVNASELLKLQQTCEIAQNGASSGAGICSGCSQGGR
jgi:hypothetical protein